MLSLELSLPETDSDAELESVVEIEALPVVETLGLTLGEELVVVDIVAVADSDLLLEPVRE